MPTNAFVWIDNPSVSVFIYTLYIHTLTAAALPASKRVCLDGALAIPPANTQRFTARALFSPRSALVEDISSGSSLPESYGKD